jgi:hypothetical protein
MVSIQVQDDVAAALAERAEQIGLSVGELLSLVAGYNSGLPKGGPTGAQLEALLRAESALHSSTASPSGTFNRAELYRDHD